MTLTALAIALAASNPAADTSAAQTDATTQPEELGAASLAKGESGQAIRALEPQLKSNPSDPALLINLGIAFAQAGEEAKARAMFKAAMSSHKQLELETADGNSTDSRRLARKAIAMLDRGEFRPANRLVMRD
ncbi:tetratricopeptide repeat protein [Erythrobacter sp. F6033]|uniref:tetratricopeptide repeat protein n=1 Tax=Erythrobacter sp. F6033 TaxID=2926401 RepID=UPI001FF2BE78|nr:tetratricopeptide repeat protein [Erythrobacter sp. F6033]MCK0127699.1 tetratricopeptide repeat protein [Erythrobacter sp. F6033]